MGSRENILEKIKANKPDSIELPVINTEVFYEELDLLAEFKKKVEIVGGNVLQASSNEDVISKITGLFPDTRVNFSVLEGTENFNTVSLEAIKRPHDLEDLDILILKSKLGVAENGSVWLSDDKLPMRVLPFITKHLVLVLKKEDVVPYLHQAYPQITSTETDYGVLISGPSKTADIEQSLVIGAHGALSLNVFLM